MYLRFVLWEPRVRPSRGLFRIAYSVQDEPEISPWLRQAIAEQTDWFDSNLPVPDIYCDRAPPRRHADALCWFRADAREHVSRARELARLLEEVGSALSLLITRWPGRVLYSDPFQIAAVPLDRTLVVA